MKFVYSEKEMASKNIAEHLYQFFPEDYFAKQDVEIMIDVKDINEEMIVLSKHKSKTSLPCLTVHTPGNPCDAQLGGKEKTLNVAFTDFQYFYLEFLSKKGLEIDITYEVDHHGPTIKSPIMFVEIGSSEKEWRNKQYGSLVAEAITYAIDKMKEERLEAFSGFGGNHYARKFTKISMKKRVVFPHIIAKYSLDCLTYDVFIQAIEKIIRRIDGIWIDKKGMNLSQRKKIIEFAKKAGVEVKM